MKDLPKELIYVLLFAAILLFHYLKGRFGPQQQQQPAQDEPDPESAEQAQGTPETSPASTLSGSRFGGFEAPNASSPLPGRRFSRRALMGTRRQVQNSIVIATILGPCRAYKPHDVR